MSLLQSLLHPSKSKTAGQIRRAWPRLHRSRGAVASQDREDKPALTTEDAEPDQSVPDKKNGAARSSEERTPLNDDDDDDDARSAHADSAQYDQQPSVDSEPARKSRDSSEVSRSQHGSKRLRNFVARLRGGKSQDGGSLLSLSDALQQTGPEGSKCQSAQAHSDHGENDVPDPVDNPGHAEIKNDPVKDAKENVPSRVPSAIARESNEQQRNASAQTACSQKSKTSGATVSRHPSQRLSMPIQDPREDSSYWSSLLNYTQEATHRPEASDPFSDGKNIETQSLARVPSKCSKQSSKRQSDASAEPSEQGRAGISRRPSSKTLASSQQASGHRINSNCSQASRSSLLSRLDPSKAAVAFNVLAAKLNVQLSIPVDDATTDGSDEKPGPGEASTPRPRHRLLNRVRPVQSNLKLEVESQPPAPKLRRTKTFASFARRPSPMTSLRGKSVETLARLGGHSFLVLPADLAPYPLQLPACIVATVMYLRKCAPSASELFVEPGDIKAATTLYDHFASQVLSAEKDEPKIALTMRVIAMPHWEKDAEAGVVLSVGWTLKALLAGLPGGILASARLYETLKAVYFAETPIPARIRFITLAIVALTSEMQCALICAVFGLLTGLLQQESTPSGNALRPVASLTDADRLARVVGPLLMGTRNDGGSAAVQDKVEREVEEQRVAGLLLEHWPRVSRQLREWSGSN